MSQDTRKDKRAKVVSLNVRYKSATVDEFIENHSHDVSKGGIFVKTPTPFPPGTLLKFEIRLAGDKSVISGVGRVVWKREPTQAGTDKPAGMGVKFIKIDDASRAVIDRLVASKADAGSAYTSDPAAVEDETKSNQPSTLRGIQAAAPFEPDPPITAQAMPAPPPPPVEAMPVPKPVAPAPAPVVTSATSGAVAARPAAGKLDKTMPMGASPLAAMMKASVPGAAPAPSATPAAPTSPAGAARPGGPPPPIAHKPATAIGVAPPPGAPATPKPLPGAGPAKATEPRPSPVAAAPAAAPPPRPLNARKATMMGVGLPAPSSAPGAGKGDIPTPLHEISPAELVDALGSSKAPVPAAGSPPPSVGPPGPKREAASPMFPVADDSKRDFESVQEPTMMKQAAELLEEALREAGGSMEEIGQNPLFTQSSQRDGKVQERKVEGPPGSSQQSGETLQMPAQPSSKVGVPSSPPPSVAPSVPPRSVPPRSAAPVKSVPPLAPLRPVGQSLRPAEKKSGMGGLIAGIVVAALAGSGVYAYKSGALAGVMGGPPTPVVSTATPTPTTPVSASAPSASASATASASAETPAPATDSSAAAALSASADAGKAAAGTDAGAAALTATAIKPVVPQAPPPPAPAPAPKPKPKPAAPAVTTTPSTTDTDTPSPAPTPTTAPSPTATATSAPTATAPAPAPTPPPAPEL